jgi:peptidoglycan-associated lipoprotein
MHSFFSRRTVMLVTASSFIAACHRQAPAVAPTASPATDDAAQLAQARADSIARAQAAQAARDDSIARAEAAANNARHAADALSSDADARALLLAPVHFDFDRAEVRPSDQTVLDRKAAILNANPGLRIRVDGNTDERGSDEYNLALGMRRAAEARRYLSNHGVDSSRVSIVSNGEERPLCQEHDDSCWSQNRRAEFAITAGGARIVAAR